MKKIIQSIVAASLLWAGAAFAQSTPNLITGQVPTAAQWNSYFRNKQDVLNFVPLNIAGGVLTGKLTLNPSSTANSGLNIPAGVAPSTPNNGDLWTTSAGIFARVNGVTVGPLSGPSGASFTATSPLAVTFPAGATNYALNFNSTLTGSGGNLGLNLATPNAWSGAQTFGGGATISGSFTATGLVKNADLVSPTATVNGVPCTLGASCTIIASAGTITIGTTNVAGGAGTLYNLSSGGALSAAPFVANGVFVSSGSSVPAWSTTLPNGLAMGLPASLTLTNATGLPISGISGLATGVPAWLAAPTSANLAAAVSDETGSGPLVFGTSPSISAPVLSGTITGTYSLGGTPSIAGSAINSGLVLPAFGGSGVNNGSFTMTRGGNWSSTSTVSITGALTTANPFTTSGAAPLTLTVTGTTNSTLPVGTHTLVAPDVAQSWTAVQQFAAGAVNLRGATSGGLTVNCAAVCGTSTLTLPGGTTDFSGTGGAGQFVKQATLGGALTVVQPAFADLTGSLPNSQLATMPAGTLKANTGGSAAVPGDVTGPAARLPALLNIDQLTTVGDANLTIAPTTRTVATTATLTAVRTFTLPAASSVNPGQTLTIVDQAGGVNGSNTITVSRAGGDTVNGTTVTAITTAYGGLLATSDGASKWTTLATGGGGGGGGGVSLINTLPGQGIVGGPITTSGTLTADTTVFAGFKTGFTLSTAGSSSTFGVTAGAATDSGNVAFIQTTASLSKTTGAWTLGAGGALDTGTIAINTWYHVFAMRRPDSGVTDVCISTTVSGCVTGSAIPTAYTQFRRIGSMLTNGSSQWTAFTQSGNQFLWSTPFGDAVNLSSSTTSQLVSLTVPPGVSVNALFNAALTTSSVQVLYSAGSSPVQVADSPSGNYSLGGSPGSGSYATSGLLNIQTNTSRQVRLVSTNTAANYAATVGWYDNFGGPAGAGASATAPSANVLQNYISGYTLSTAGSSATYSLSTGSATDSLNAGFIVLSNAISKTTTAWSVGNNVGGLDTGSLTGLTWYHAFVIQRPDTGVVDSCISLNVSGCTTGGNIPSAYTMQRRVGSMKTNGSGQWIKFIQSGSRFWWDIGVGDISAAAVSSSGALYTLPSVPTGLSVTAILNLGMFNNAAADLITVTSPLVSAPTPNTPAGNYSTITAQAGYSSGLEMQIDTDTSARIRAASGTASGTTLYGVTKGWIDTRNGPNITGGNAGVSSIGGASGVVNLGTGLSQSGNTINGTSFNGRSGAVTPQTGDYNYGQISGTFNPANIQNPTTYSPSITCDGGGTFGGGTATVNTAEYIVFGKYVFVNLAFTATNIGTCANYFTIGLPFASAAYGSLSGVTVSTGVSMQATVQSLTANFTSSKFNNTGGLGGSGNIFAYSGMYRIP